MKKRTRPRHPVASFDEFYVQMLPRIEAHTRTQRVIGMDADDVRQELLITLWQAWFTWDPDESSTLQQHFWALWLQRKADLIRYHLAMKRDARKDATVTFEAHEWEALLPIVTWEDLYEEGRVPACPEHEQLACSMWQLLARGSTAREVMQHLGISKRTYYRIIEGWRTPAVYAALA